MKFSDFILVGILIFLCIFVGVIRSEVLTPPYFNLAQARRITATSTCGEDYRELYCKLVGANADSDVNINLIQGQVCDYCDMATPGKEHPAKYAIDGTEAWWQSVPLSRGKKHNEVNLTIDLGQEFHVAYVLITMGNSPRPGVWALERSIDNGKTWKAWQYFADNPNVCEKFFGKNISQVITADDSVICETEYSKVVPLEGGEIVVSLLKNRPSSTDFFSSGVLQEWTRATNIRMRLIRTKTLLGHLMSVARQDPTVTRRYFYSIKDIQIGGRCRCNGHADLCDITDPKDVYKLLCRCQHNTCGAQCEVCCPGYVQKAWRPSTDKVPFRCEQCNCFGHSEECFYDAEVDGNKTSIDMMGDKVGGGVCTNCRDNTEGVNCNQCSDGYYRPYGRALDAKDVCEPCQCDSYFSTGNCAEGSGKCECRKEFLPPDCQACNTGYYDWPNCKACDCHFNGTRGAVCEVGGGQCPCKQNYAGTNCNKCAEGFFNFPQCDPCECETLGSVSPVCDPEGGQCECGNNYGTRQCNECENGYSNFPICSYCNCDIRGTREGICDKLNGECLCREGYGGARCDQCLPSYFGYPDCRQCNCSTAGSATTICDATGKCPCLPNFSGRMCDQCTPGWYLYPECLPCDCYNEGSMGVSCDDEGKCQCKINFDSLRCETCKAGYYNIPLCEECNCDPSGVIETFRGCGDSPPGELCQCKSRVQGRICNDCKPLFWNLQLDNALGCEDCECHLPGILGGVNVCEGKGGQCPCKSLVQSRKCEECKDGYYNLQAEDILGCQDCGCDVGGSVNSVCDKTTGQCNCRPRINDLTCVKPIQSHYFPTLFQFQYEAEDGNTPSGGNVRFGYDNSLFPDYSWRGYAIYSQLQPETTHEIHVDKSSLYRIVLRYLNPSENTIVGEIILTPDNPNDVEQKYKVRFEPKNNFLTVSTGNVPSPFVLNPGRWHVQIKTDQYLLVDYFTLLPAAYYEASILQKKVSEPCQVNVTARSSKNIIIPDVCLKLNYPAMDKFDSIPGSQSYAQINGGKNKPKQFYKEKKVIETLGVKDDSLVLLGPEDQKEIHFEMKVNKGGRYVLVLEYFTPLGQNLTKLILDSTSKKGKMSGEANIYNCRHSTLCRSVVTSDEGEINVFKFDQNSINFVIEAPAEGLENPVALHSITAIPLGKWSLDYIRPKEFCVMKKGSCIESSYDLPPDSIKVEAELGREDSGEEIPEGSSTEDDRKLVVLDAKDRTIELSGKVPSAGYYTFLVHYHQPENPDFLLDAVIENGQHYEAKVSVVHCPSTSGCRTLVSQEDSSRFYIEENFKITLKSPKKVWIDYILIVPSYSEDISQFEKYLGQRAFDETRRFIAECGKNHMYIQNKTGFCRDSVFSLTSEFNNGALPCNCDFSGSLSFDCEEFGGQCKCRENMIGRRCEKCRTGFFGFPNCKPCDCPSTALCDEVTGECICPPNVIGDRCQNCAAQTYGFDPMIGCENCDCNNLGVVEGNLQCDLENGQCECKQNVVGRNCDKCLSGYWAFPYCQLCDCDVRGTTEEICNQESSQCSCKVNVEGRSCENCKIGSYNLEEKNPTGCSKCFCFGKTSRCSSSSLFWKQISPRKNAWKSVGLDPSKIPGNGKNYGVEFEEISSEEEASGQFIPVYIPEGSIPQVNETHVIYFAADLSKGQFLNSYGAKLTYFTISDPEDDTDRDTFGSPDVILEARDLSNQPLILMYFSVEHLDGDHAMRMTLRLTEENFVVYSSSGGLISATREQVMIALKGLAKIYLRATYWRNTREAKLGSFNIDLATEEFTQEMDEEDKALSVEHCQCPRNYQGLSCEECSPGYFRSSAGPFGGFCIPCECNGHSDTCDPDTGVCNDCRYNTTGDHCDKCQAGYHGDATNGTPYDCLICACPLPLVSNNFASSCELSSDGLEIHCQCAQGYAGSRCETCGPGYFGQPEIPGETCQPCQCSENIDVTDPYACDRVSGACLKCLNNTANSDQNGSCDICAPGYHGEAVIKKNCKKCDCNECGTEECDHTNGECRCLNNIIGVNCDRCAADHFGMSRCDGSGCHFCECGIASFDTQCDDSTGQCECQKGASGRRCERCAPGYWNYTEDGCQSCECNQEYAIGVGCDWQTGQCSCLPGVVGEKCDRCPHRWVLIQDRGCQVCDSCQHQLLDDTDALALELNPVITDFESVAKSYFTAQRLTYFNDTVNEMKPNVKLMDPTKVELGPYTQSLLALENESKSLKQKADVTSASLKDKAKVSLALRENSIEIESKVQESVHKARIAVFETKDLLEGLMAEEQFSSPQTDQALIEARAIIDLLQKVEFDPSDAEKEREISTQIVQDMVKFVEPIVTLQKDLQKYSDKIEKIKDRIKDLRNQSDYSVATAKKANEYSYKIKEGKFEMKLKLLEGRAGEMVENLANSTEKNKGLPAIVKEAEGFFQNSERLLSSIRNRKDPLSHTMSNLKNELENHKDTVGLSQEHAVKLKIEADSLDRMLIGSREASENALAAATSYQKITDTFDEALKAAHTAKENSDNATIKTQGIGALAQSAKEPSQNLLVLAQESISQVETDLKIPLEDFKMKINEIESMNKETVDSLNTIDKSLGLVKISDNSDSIEDSIGVSTQGQEKAELGMEDVEKILEKLPDKIMKSKDLPVIVKDLNKRVEIAEDQLKQARESIPLSAAITGDLEEKRPKLEDRNSDLATKISALKSLIAEAREQANRINVGMNLVESSSLLLANPQSLESQQAQSKISIHFKTSEPDGNLLYIGNEPGRRGEGDFMAVEIEGGYPTLAIDLGSGPQRIHNEKFVADDKWYKATIDRTGKMVRFIIAEESVDGTITETIRDEYLSGSKSLFNVDQNTSRIYIGGPPGEKINPNLKSSTFRGAVQDLMIGDQLVGLWNFKDSQNIQPAYEKDRFLNLKPETGLRFQGNGYALVESKKYPLKHKSALRINFKTRAKNGLIFLAGKGRKFMSIEILNGTVLFQYNLGSGVGRIASTRKYDDNRWHIVDAVRQKRIGILRIDLEEIGRFESPEPGSSLGVSEYIYFGGYPGGAHGYPSVTSKAFEGCLDQISIESLVVDLTQAPETRFTLVGCPSAGGANTIATFHGNGFLKLSPTPAEKIDGPAISTAEEVFELNFRFKSNGTHGLLFYGTNEDQSNFLSIAMAEGSLYIKSDSAQIKTDPLNDSQWHLITVTNDRKQLIVNIDDVSEFSEAVVQGVPLSMAESSIYFGGRPEDFEMKIGASVADSPFSGCLSDIHVNGRRLDFTDAEIHESALSQSCVSENDLKKEMESILEMRKNLIIPKDGDVDEDENNLIPLPPNTPKGETDDDENKIFDEDDYFGPEEDYDDYNAEKKPRKDHVKPYKGCKLPYREMPMDSTPQEINLEDGVRFGNYDRTSRMEFNQQLDDGSRSDYSLEFKTSEPEGVLFMWSDFDRIDFVTLYMKRGKLHYAFDSGSGQALLNSSSMLNDSLWHSAQFTRFKEKGELTIDGVTVATGISQGSTTNINAGPTVFIGGLSKEAWSRRMTTKKMQSVESPFRGCIRNFMMKNRNPGTPKLMHSVEPCTENTEPGYEFYPNNAGYLKMTDKFKVGRNIKITLSIRPRHPSGLLLSVHGDRDYLVLQMINGTIKFTVDNGKGSVSSSFSKDVYDLCDGNWHTIQASKSKNVVTLSLDNLFSAPGIGAGGISATDTNHPLYLGGHPTVDKVRGVEAKEQYVGCMRDLIIENNRQNKLGQETVIGKVGLHSCRSD